MCHLRLQLKLFSEQRVTFVFEELKLYGLFEKPSATTTSMSPIICKEREQKTDAVKTSSVLHSPGSTAWEKIIICVKLHEFEDFIISGKKHH